MISIVIDKEVMDRVCKEAERLKIPVAELVDSILRRWVADQEDKRKYDPKERVKGDNVGSADFY